MSGENVTAAEKRNQVGGLLFDCQEAESDTAHVEEQCRQIASALNDVQMLLEKRADFKHQYWKDINLDDERYSKAMNVLYIKSLLDELEQGRKKRDDLRKRVRALGLPFLQNDVG